MVGLALGAVMGRSTGGRGCLWTMSPRCRSYVSLAWSMSSESGRGPIVVRILRGLTLALVRACAPGRIRTCDTGFRRAVLYPLSYGGSSHR
jgi:hypothetical protein